MANLSWKHLTLPAHNIFCHLSPTCNLGSSFALGALTSAGGALPSSCGCTLAQHVPPSISHTLLAFCCVCPWICWTLLLHGSLSLPNLEQVSSILTPILQAKVVYPSLSQPRRCLADSSRVKALECSLVGDQGPIPVEACRQPDGSWACSFTPVQEGFLRLELTVNGTLAGCSPYSIQVLEIWESHEHAGLPSRLLPTMLTQWCMPWTAPAARLLHRLQSWSGTAKGAASQAASIKHCKPSMVVEARTGPAPCACPRAAADREPRLIMTRHASTRLEAGSVAPGGGTECQGCSPASRQSA